MKMILAASILLLVLPCEIHGRAGQNKSGGTQITLPPPQTQTVPSDVSFQLGQQSGKIDAMTKRLDNIENDVKEIGRDVGRLNVYASIAGLVIAAIVIPLVYEAAKRLVFRTKAATPTP